MHLSPLSFAAGASILNLAGSNCAHDCRTMASTSPQALPISQHLPQSLPCVRKNATTRKHTVRLNRRCVHVHRASKPIPQNRKTRPLPHLEHIKVAVLKALLATDIIRGHVVTSQRSRPHPRHHGTRASRVGFKNLQFRRD